MRLLGKSSQNWRPEEIRNRWPKLSDKNTPHLSSPHHEQAVKLILRHEDIFSRHDGNVDLTNVVTHKIPLKPEAKPKAQKPYRTTY